MGGEGVHTAHTHTVQSAAHFVGAFVEFTAGVQHGHDYLQCRFVQFLVLVDGNASSVVEHRDGVVLVDGHLYMGAETGHCLVDGVVDRFVYKVVKTFLTDVANIHGRTFTHSLETFEHLYVIGRIIAFVLV